MILLVAIPAASAASSLAVFDGVFDAAACGLLHRAASARGLGHALFARSASPSTPLEEAFESYLREIGDDAPLVEYWSRQEWRHIEAHRDVDEKLAADGGSLRCPRHGHVLYLQVGSRVRGPTCVWEGDYVEQGLVAVPAVEGRVLRFDGDLAHAVPKPADVWLAPFTVSQSGAAEDFVRSVVLFNTWTDAPPLDVAREDAAAAASLDGGAAATARCRPRVDWRAAPLHSPEGEEEEEEERGCATATMKLWLLGDVARRGQAERTLRIPVHGEAVHEALLETERCTRLAPRIPC